MEKIIGIIVGVIAIVLFVLLFTWIIDKFGKDKRRKHRVDYSSGKKEFAGELGEVFVANEVEKSNLKNAIVINDYYTINDNGKSAQIDHIVLSEEGVFCIETKNIEGIIYGSEDEREWTQLSSNGNSKRTFYNPLKQNKTHTYILKNMLPKSVYVNSIVVFVQNNAPNVDGVINFEDLVDYLNNFNRKVLTVDKIEKIKKKLDKNEIVDEDIKEKHIESIREMQEDVENNICPRCGGRLILKEGKYGKFYGCENYPKCKFRKDIEN